jgi:hypothetical protein
LKFFQETTSTLTSATNINNDNNNIIQLVNKIMEKSENIMEEIK